MAEDITQYINLGACALEINGVDAGHFDEGGLKVAIKSSIVEGKAAKYGDVPVAKWLNGQRIELEGQLIQTDNTQLVEVLPGAVKVTDGSGDSKLTFGKIGGTPIPPVDVVLTPYLPANDPAYVLTLKAAPVGDFELVYSGTQGQVWKIKLEGVINEAGGADGSYLFSFGDPTITPDVTPPTVSSVSPTNGATGVAVGDNVVWTLSEDLDGNTVNDDNVFLMADPGGPTGLKVAGTVTLNNNGASTTITFNPTSSLAAGTKYIAVLQNIKDRAGNLLASGFYATDFTTAP